MKRILAFFLNLPWTVMGLGAALLSGPTKLTLSRNPLALVFQVRSYWWYDWIPGKQGVRASTTGNVIILGPHALEHDLQHEFVHIEQLEREPFVHPILNMWETHRHGYRKNKYEDEAYSRAGNVYKRTSD